MDDGLPDLQISRSERSKRAKNNRQLYTVSNISGSLAKKNKYIHPLWPMERRYGAALSLELMGGFLSILLLAP